MAIEIKLCVNCDKVKNLNTEFYKAGSSWQKLCKLCHNEKRNNYKHEGTKYIKKETGFFKLPLELQNKIKYNIKVKVNFKDIAEKYKNEGVKYQTLLKWSKKGIPEYTDEILTI